MTSREILKLLRKDGWQIVDQQGSHIHLKHPSKRGKITIPNHVGKDIPIKTLMSVLKQAGLEKESGK